MKQLEEQQTSEAVAEFYAAALEFIDPKLTLDTPLGVIEAAADTQRMALARQRGASAKRRTAELNEALEFVRRSYTRVRRAPADTAEEHPAGWDGAELRASEALRERELSLPGTAAEPSGNGNGYANGNGHAHGNGNGDGKGNGYANGNGIVHAEPTAAAVTEANAAETEQPPSAPVNAETAAPAELSDSKRGANRFAAAIASHESRLGSLETEGRRSPLSRLWEADENDVPCGDLLPEQLALPHIHGFALLLWQAALALGVGVVATRLIVWPHPGLGYGLEVLPGIGVVLLGIATAACCAFLSWRHRLRSRAVATMAYTTVGAVALYMLAWWRAADPALPIIHPPTALHVTLLTVASISLVAWAHLNDARQRCSTPTPAE
jgi:hypothetical protein